MDQNPEMPSVSAPKSNKEEHEKILAALRKEFDYDTGASGKDHYQQICRTLEAIENIDHFLYQPAQSAGNK